MRDRNVTPPGPATPRWTSGLRRRAGIRSPLVALALVAVFAGTALATDASGFGPAVPISNGTISESVHYNTGAVKFQTKGPVDLKTVSVVITPGGTSGWHSHPGVVLVTVKEGAVAFYDKECTRTVHPVNSSFVEAAGDGPGVARNEGTVNAMVIVTYIVPGGTTVFRINESNPGCPGVN